MNKILSTLFGQNLSDISDYMPLLAFHDDKTMITKNGNYCRVLLVDGIDYTSYSSDSAKASQRLRVNCLKSIPETIHIYFHSIRTHERVSFDDSENHINDIASIVAKRWGKKFESTYATQHYIVLSTGKESALDEFDALLKKQDRDINRLSDLEEASVMVKKLLNELNPIELNRNGLCTFFGNILNGSNKRHIAPITNFDDYLHESTIEFPVAKPYMSFEDGDKKRYSMVLAIKFFESDSDTSMLDEILHHKAEFRVCQYAQKISKITTLNMLEDREKTVKGFFKSSDTALYEIHELRERIQNDEVALMRYNYTIFCYGKNIEECKKTIDDLRSIVHQYGFTATIESSNIEALFWSQFPTNHHYLIRKRFMTNENVADFQSFARTGAGLQSCSWGHEPHTKFITNNGTVYNFVFQKNITPQALGHTLVFGGSDSGKTTLITFLISACQRYTGFKSLIFDKLQGTRIFTDSHNGVYTDFGENVELNPLQLPNTKENRAFLSHFFQSLANMSDIESEETINKAIDSLYKHLSVEDRTFDNLLDAFGLSTHSNLRRALNQWSSNGANGNIFTAVNDALDFEKDIVSFNMDTLFKNHKALINTMLYITHKFKEVTKNNFTPHLIFVDELPQYLVEETFEKIIEEWVLEIRKLEGVFIGAAQSPNHVSESKIGTKLIGSCANFIFFKDPTADVEVLKNVYELNDTEIEWIKYLGEPRQILFKRNGGESVILNVDLSDIGGYLNLFNSSSSKRKKVEELKASSDNWIEHLIKEN